MAETTTEEEQEGEEERDVPAEEKQRRKRREERQTHPHDTVNAEKLSLPQVTQSVVEVKQKLKGVDLQNNRENHFKTRVKRGSRSKFPHLTTWNQQMFVICA